MMTSHPLDSFHMNNHLKTILKVINNVRLNANGVEDALNFTCFGIGCGEWRMKMMS